MDLHWKSGSHLAKLICSGACTSVEVVQLLIARIKEHDHLVNAVVVRDFDNAIRRAQQADEATLQGKSWGVLHGVPMTVKESNDVKGLPTTIGNPKNSGKLAIKNSEAVQRLLDAGVIIIGKTNLAFDVNDVQSYNPVYGCCNNPFNPSRTTGGSSGGSAAALASGFTPIELGGDIGGSIRVPAHCCGIFGHKTTFGVIHEEYQDIAAKGPLARCADDLTLLLDILAGPSDEQTKFGFRHTLMKHPQRPLNEYRVAIWGDDVCCPVDKDVATAVDFTTKILREAGCTVEACKPDFDSAAMFDLYKQLLSVAENSHLSEEEFAKAQARAASFETSDHSDIAKQCRWIVQSYHMWHKANAIRNEMRQKWHLFFEKFDVLIAPICCAAAWAHDHSGTTDQPFWKVGDRVIRGNGVDTIYHKQVFWSGVTNVCFNPSTAFPAGRTSDGMPIGLQAVGAEYNDHTTINFVKALSSACPTTFGFKQPTTQGLNH